MMISHGYTLILFGKDDEDYDAAREWLEKNAPWFFIKEDGSVYAFVYADIEKRFLEQFDYQVGD